MDRPAVVVVVAVLVSSNYTVEFRWSTTTAAYYQGLKLAPGIEREKFKF